MSTIPSECDKGQRPACEHVDGLEYGGQATGQQLRNCERPKSMNCSSCGVRVHLIRCGSANKKACPPCANTYRRRVSLIAQSGFAIIRKGQWVFMTFTAPGDRQHGYRGFTCPCTPMGGIDIGKWNGEAVHRWNRLQQAIEREWGVTFAYFRAAEVQERGALHFHVLARFDGQVVMKASRLRSLAIRHGFGHEVDVQAAGGDGRRQGSYVSKYVTKAATERRSVPYVHRKTGERGPGRWRTWTASRDWGWTMADVRAAQVAWMAIEREDAGAEPLGRSPEAGALDNKTTGYASAFPTSPERPLV